MALSNVILSIDLTVKRCAMLEELKKELESLVCGV